MIKELLLQKGWAGKTISRQETVERLNPLIRQLIELNYTYDAAARATTMPELSAGIMKHQKISRADVGKLAETVFSCGGTAYNGTELEPQDYAANGEDREIIDTLIRHEQEMLGSLEAESEIEHQMRTRAILSVLKKNGEDRLEFLREMNAIARKP